MNMHAAQETDQEQMAQTQKQIIAPLEKAEETQADFNHDVPSRVKKTHKTELDLSRSMFKVLHTPELFELILLQLPMKDLLLAQGISRHFKETIRGSVRLQRQLFLAPAPIVFALPVLVDGGRRLMRFDVVEIEETTEVYADDEGVVPGVAVWVAISSICDAFSYSTLLKNTPCYPSGSWHRIYLTQPPCAIKWTVHYGEIVGGPEKKALTTREMWPDKVDSKYEPKTVIQYKEYFKAQALKRGDWWTKI